MVLYRAGRYLEAYDLITEQAASPDAMPALVYYFRFSFACRAGMHDLALSLLREAIIDRGFWYSPDYLGDEDLEPLRGLSEFNELAEISAEREGSPPGAHDRKWRSSCLARAEINGQPWSLLCTGISSTSAPLGSIGTARPGPIVCSPSPNHPVKFAPMLIPGWTLRLDRKRSFPIWMKYSRRTIWTRTGRSWGILRRGKSGSAHDTQE